MTFKVFVDDNFHFMDEEERDLHGEYGTREEAVAAARAIVNASLADLYREGMSAEQLLEQYKSFGDDPFVAPSDDSTRFSAWDYASERCREICGGEEKR